MTKSEPKKNLTPKQKVFINEYLKSFNATDAAIKAGYSPKTAYSIGSENLRKPEIKQAIREIIDPLIMGEPEVLIGVTQQARADIGSFFKIVTEWVRFPLPSYEVINEELREITILDKVISVPFYEVRHVCLDTDKLIDPKYSSLVKKFADSPKSGLSIEIHDKQAAFQLIAKLNGMLTENVNLNMKGEMSWKQFVEQAEEDDDTAPGD